MKAIEPVEIAYYSDVLCIWAYASQIKLDALRKHFGARVAIEHHFIPVFGNTRERIGQGWKDRGGFPGYGRYVREMAKSTATVELDSEVWTRNIPPTSGNSHLFLKSIQLLEDQGTVSAADLEVPHGRSLVEEVAWRIRQAFFRDVRDVAAMATLRDIAKEMDLPTDAIVEQIESGAAIAAFCSDIEQQNRLHIEGSPTFLINEGRQRLYGNIGYLVIEANIHELLQGNADKASWC